MKKQEKQLEMEVNGIPDLSKAPKDLLQLFFEAMLEVIQTIDKKEKPTDCKRVNSVIMPFAVFIR